MARNLTQRLWLALALIVVPFLVLIGFETYQSMGLVPALRQSRQPVVHTREVISTAQALELAVRDAESGERGYLLTGQSAYLDPYRSGIRDAPILLANLKQLTADNPEQQSRLPNLEKQIDTKLAELQKTIETRDREGFEAAREIVRTNSGLDSMRAISGLIASTIAAENGLLAERQSRIVAEERRTAQGAMVSGILAFAIMTLGIVLAVLAFRTLERAEGARSESEQHLGLLVDGVADHAIYMLDPQGNVTSWNDGAGRLKGYRAGEIVGQHFSGFYTDEDRKAGVPEKALETALLKGKYEGEGWRVRKDGSRFWASVAINPLRDSTGRVLGFAKISRDITERRAQQQALEQTRAELAQAQKMDALGQLSGGIAHDFNNLLAVILNCVELLHRRLQIIDPEVRQTVDMIKRNAERAARLTQRLLAFSRRQALAPQQIDPNKLVSGMSDLLRRALGESIALETVLGSGVWLTSVDPNQLETAILNLAINSRDAMLNGGKLTIETANTFLDEAYAAAHREVTPGQYAMIAVSDTGLGMNKEVIAKAFDPFFTTKEHGTGLGLSQVFGFIKQSGGHVKIYSESGEGTTVKLYLPRLLAAEAAEALSDVRPVVAHSDGETILLVDDEEDVRASTAQLLRDLGYRVMVATDARTALEVMEKEPDIDLLFTDVGLPNGINGRQLADDVRGRWPAVKVLFTTGYARNAIVHHGRLDPGVELIVKPFTHSGLADKVRRVLDGAVADEE